MLRSLVGSEMCIRDRSTLSQKSTISTKGNIIRGTISTGDSRKFIKFMFDEIMVYDKSYITFDGNKITNDGGVFGNAFKLEDTSISICGDSALSFSNNIISSTAAPLISSNPNDMLKYWSIWISSNKLVIAFGGLIEVINNQVSILSPSGALNSNNSSEYGHGIHLEMPTSDIGVASLVDVSGNTCLLYTSDAADEEDSVDLGGRRIIKKKKYIRRRV
eukprot:TRINITY_DN12489_c0_g3_i1.p1 TRINITY_DN12489_c0_g3~~TRINITY_DN12489_c0_g3_i1.p1  ORF type:complete len:233 (+),score=70.10 TRINITY_DN12489_c0_g3_i1:46-699(+)